MIKRSGAKSLSQTIGRRLQLGEKHDDERNRKSPDSGQRLNRKV